MQIADTTVLNQSFRSMPRLVFPKDYSTTVSGPVVRPQRLGNNLSLANPIAWSTHSTRTKTGARRLESQPQIRK
jgi:hypothetical protein